MAVYLDWTLPVPVVAAKGDTVTLPEILNASFGASPNGWSDFWVTYYGPAKLENWDFTYWDPDAPAVARWFVDGTDIGGGFNNQQFVSGDAVDSAVLHAGNDIGALAYVTVPIAGPSGGAATEYIQYSMIVLDPHVISPVFGHGAPTPQDIVDSAHRFADFYGLVPNDNDCHNIATAVAAATGATLTDNSYFTDPTQNEEAGFWRIAYRGSDPNPVADWQTLVQPGDIVRMDWAEGTFHTTTVLDKNPDGSIVVYDNVYPGEQVTEIGIHSVNYWQDTIPESITIYRLTTDGLYLINGTSTGELLPGTVFNDDMRGLGGADTLNGAIGNDVLTGGGGADTLNGGDGLDTAVYSGARASYTIARGVDTVTITGPNGTDTLTSVERLQFADSTVALKALANDFNGDGHTDLLFSDASSDYLWMVNDRDIGSQGPVDLYDPAFSVQVTGDFDGDGKSDILFENPNTGGVWQWQLNGTAIDAQGAVDVGDKSYHLLGTADFDGDGKSDVLWQNDAGFIYQWQMDGFHNTPLAVGALDPAWHLQGAGDFDGDGKADLLMRNVSATADNGAYYLWKMDGNTIEGQGGIERPPTTWQTLGLGDFDGDGKTDFAVRNVSNTADNGAVWVYLMDGTTIKGQGAAGIADAATWQVASIGDLNGDGRDDILYRDTAGHFYSWDMNGTAIDSEGALPWADPAQHVVTQHWDLA